VFDVMLKLIAEMLDERAYRHGRSVTEGADRAALDIVGDVVQQREIFRFPAAVLDAIDHAVEPACAFPAGRALAA